MDNIHSSRSAWRVIIDVADDLPAGDREAEFQLTLIQQTANMIVRLGGAISAQDQATLFALGAAIYRDLQRNLKTSGGRA